MLHPVSVLMPSPEPDLPSLAQDRGSFRLTVLLLYRTRDRISVLVGMTTPGREAAHCAASRVASVSVPTSVTVMVENRMLWGAGGLATANPTRTVTVKGSSW